MAVNDIYTNDGTVDIHDKPSIKKETGNWKACSYILGNELCERLAYYGMGTNLVNYLKIRLNQSSTTAANNVTNWSRMCYIMPLLGAFVADAFLGRYWTIASFSIIYFLGMALLALTTSVSGLKPSCDGDDCHPTKGQTTVFFIALYLIALGTGGIKPCVSSFGADQFLETDESENKKKSSFFNWFYFSININVLIASSVLVWIQMNVGWGVGFWNSCSGNGDCGREFLLRDPSISSPEAQWQPHNTNFPSPDRRKFQVKVPADKSLLYENAKDEFAIQGSCKLDHTKQFGFLDKADVLTETDDIKGNVNPWRLCTMT